MKTTKRIFYFVLYELLMLVLFSHGTLVGCTDIHGSYDHLRWLIGIEILVSSISLIVGFVIAAYFVFKVIVNSISISIRASKCLIVHRNATFPATKNKAE